MVSLKTVSIFDSNVTVSQRQLVDGMDVSNTQVPTSIGTLDTLLLLPDYLISDLKLG